MISLVFYDNDITKKNALFFRQSQPLHFPRKKHTWSNRSRQPRQSLHTLESFGYHYNDWV